MATDIPESEPSDVLPDDDLTEAEWRRVATAMASESSDVLPDDDLTEAEWRRVATAMALADGKPEAQWACYLAQAKTTLAAFNEIHEIARERWEAMEGRRSRS